MTEYSVLLTHGAEQDLKDLYEYLSTTESIARANRLLNAMESAFQTLRQFPERGSRPIELTDHGILDYRQVLLRPYRIIYKIEHQKVLIYVIADTRRNFQSLLLRRLLSH